MLSFFARNKTTIVFIGFLAISLLGIVDYITGHEMSLSAFYLAPISFLTWTVGRRFGILASVASALVETMTNIFAGLAYSHPFILYWNTTIETLFFIVVVFAISELRAAFDREKILARTDSLTGLPNRQAFFDLANREVERCRRYNCPLTIAYIDCDNFKQVNDTMGHDRGDDALRSVAMVLKGNIRASDIAARLGGDEFAVLLPEAGHEGSQVFSKIRDLLLREMQRGGFPITFSIGVATFFRTGQGLEEILKSADRLMYSVKNDRKNMVLYKSFE